MTEPAILFVNLRGVPSEDRSALIAARRLGYAVDLVAPSLPAHAAGLVRQFRPADTDDPEQGLCAARALAERAAPSGVVTWGDRGVELVALIGQELGLPALSPAAGRRARHKVAMKQAVAHLPGIVGRHVRVVERSDLGPALLQVGFPAVLKPAAAAGSAGIFELRDRDQAEAAFDRLAGWLQTAPRPFRGGGQGELILEELIEGPEFSLEGWVHGGFVTIAGVTDKWTTDGFHLEYQHVHPSGRLDGEQRLLREGAELVVRTLGLDQCAFHLECKLTPRGFRLIEVAGRTGGDYIGSHLVPLSTGVDFHANCIRVACGRAPQMGTVDSLCAGVRFLLARSEGTLLGLDGLAEVLQMGAVEHVFMEVPVGSTLRLPPDDYDLQRVAAVVARGPEHSAVIETLERAARCCIPRVERSGRRS
jgi:biotin carboxylase